MKKNSQLARLGFALNGLNEASFRTEVAAIVGVLILLVWWRPPLAWCMTVLLAATLVVAAELFNTAIENLCDAVHPDDHPLIGIAKDCSSAAVLVTVLYAVMVFGGLLYWKFG